MYFAIADEGTDGYRLRWRRGDEVRYDISSLTPFPSEALGASDGCNLQRARPPARFPSRPCHALVMGADTRLNIVQVPRRARASRRGEESPSKGRSERSGELSFIFSPKSISLQQLAVSVTFCGIRGIAGWH